MTTLVLLRHAPTAYNVDGRLQGSLDVPLGDLGADVAATVAGALVSRYGSDIRLLSSPLARARSTAEAVAAAADVDLTVEQGLTQRTYGEWEGLTWDEVRDRWPDEYRVRRRGGDPNIAGWEATAALAARVGEVLRAAATPGPPVVAVSHGSAIGAGVYDLLGLSFDLRILGKIAHAHWAELKGLQDGTWSLMGYGLGGSSPGKWCSGGSFV